MFNNKKYYRERKASIKVKNKIERDTLNRNIKEFSITDIIKTTKLERKSTSDNLKRDKKTIPTYNTTTMKKPSLSAYGTYLEKKNKEQKTKNLKTKKKTQISRFNKKPITKYNSTITTINDYITNQQLKKREELKKKNKIKININEKSFETTKKPFKFSSKIRKTLKNKKVNETIKDTDEDTIDLLLKKLPID